MLSNRNKQVLLIIVILAALMRLGLIVRPAELLGARPFIEDAYYSLSVARSIGHGSGISVDGQTKTNGVQPLIVLMYAPVFYFFSDEMALRICLLICFAIEACLVFFCCKLLEHLIRTKSIRLIRAQTLTAVLLLFSFSTTVYTHNGLETGLSALIIIMSLVRYYSHYKQGCSSAGVLPFILIGLLLGLSVLARIDAGFFVLLFIIVHFLNSRRVESLRIRTVQTVVMSLICAAVSAPWFVYNYFYFGSLVPTSGLSQSMVIPLSENLTALLQTILNSFLIVGYIPYTQSLQPVHLAMVAGMLILPAIIIARPRVRMIIMASVKGIHGYWRLERLIPALGFVFLLMCYYVFRFGAPHFLQRYLFLFHVIMVLLVSILGSEIYSGRMSQYARRTRIIANSIFAFVFCLYLIPYSWNYLPSKFRQNDFFLISTWIKAHTAVNQRVGMGQSGTSGFFNRNVTNLDGKVNYAVFSALRNNGFCGYLDSARFDYLIDWDYFFERIQGCSVFPHYRYLQSVGRFRIYQRKE